MLGTERDRLGRLDACLDQTEACVKPSEEDSRQRETVPLTLC